MAEQPALIPMASGEALRARRLALGLSLGEVSRQIKCPQPILEAIEGDQAVAMAPVYLRGHIKRYCELLELDAELTAGILDSYGNESPGVQTIFETRPRTRASDRWLRVASYVLASLLVGTLAWQVTHEAVRLANVDSRNETETPRPADIDNGSAGHVNASIASLENLHAPVGSRTGNAGVQAWRALETARQAEMPVVDGSHRLVLETSADSWVEITGANGELLEQDLLRGGESRQYSDNGPFRVSLGRSSAVSLMLDGRAIDLAPFTRDDVARLLLDPASLPENISGPEAEPTPEPATGPTPEG